MPSVVPSSVRDAFPGLRLVAMGSRKKIVPAVRKVIFYLPPGLIGSSPLTREDADPLLQYERPRRGCRRDSSSEHAV